MTRRSLIGREQDTTPFNTILLRMCDATAAIGAALVDCAGETVDFAGALDPFDIKVAAAEWNIILDLISHSTVPTWSDSHEILVRGGRASFVVIPMAEGYSVVAQLVRHAFSISPRAVAEAVRDLSHEAGLPTPASTDGVRWSRVEVLPSPHDDRRPEAIWRGGSWSPLTVLGRYREGELPDSEVGYRVRLAADTDVTLVREPLGVWYADDVLSE